MCVSLVICVKTWSFSSGNLCGNAGNDATHGQVRLCHHRGCNFSLARWRDPCLVPGGGCRHDFVVLSEGFQAVDPMDPVEKKQVY